MFVLWRDGFLVLSLVLVRRRDLRCACWLNYWNSVTPSSMQTLEGGDLAAISGVSAVRCVPLLTLPDQSPFRLRRQFPIHPSPERTEARHPHRRTSVHNTICIAITSTRQLQNRKLPASSRASSFMPGPLPQAPQRDPFIAPCAATASRLLFPALHPPPQPP